MRKLAAGSGTSVLLLVVVCAASAGGTTYSRAATKACLVKKGTQVQSPQTGAQATLPPAQRLESLVGTLPVGKAPLFLYLAIAKSPSEAVRVRNALKRTIVPNPTSGDSWSGEKANAAWIVVSIAGTSPGTPARSLVLSCLKQGKPPTAPESYVKSDVALCMQAEGRASVLSAKDIAAVSKLLVGTTIPGRFAPHLLFAYTSTSSSAKDGFGLLALFGKSRADALSLRTQLDRALGGRLLGPAIWTGSKKNVAWAADRIRGTTAAGIASGKRTLLSCLP